MHNKAEVLFVKNILDIINNGSDDFDGDVRPAYKDGTPSHTKFITQSFEKYDISKGEFPITSLRNIPWKSGVKEIMWIFQAQTSDLSILRDKYNIHWWSDWNIGDDTIGRRYGATVDKYNLIDNLLDGLIKQPYGRRHIMSLWQESDFMETEGLKPCAYETLWSVRNDKSGVKYLDMTLIQRSSDYLVAGHINKIQYVALMMMVAKHCGYEVGVFSHYVNNLHIYDRHFEQAKELVRRYNEILEKEYLETLTDGERIYKPKLVLDTNKTNFYDFTIDDFKMECYNPIKPQLKFELGI